MTDSHENSVITFYGVIDLDSPDEFFKEGNYREAYAIRNGHGSEVGVVRPMSGDYEFPIDLPNGTNIVIGGCEDKRRQSYIFFVWNNINIPAEQHSLYRWFPNEQDPNNPNQYGRLELLYCGDIPGLQSFYKIVHCELIDDKYLVWTDARADKYQVIGNPPRMLNIEKLSVYEKKREYELYAGIENQNQFVDGLVFSALITDDEGDEVVAETPFYTAAGVHNDPEAGMEALADAFNVIAEAEEWPMSAEYCGCKIIFRSLLPNINLEIISDTTEPVPWLVPRNFYAEITEDIINMAKRPPAFEPVCYYGNDPDVNYNYVKRAMFQFRIRYHYEGGVKSAWGPISTIPLPLDAAGNHLTGLNHIIVDFTADILNRLDGLTIIRKVEIAFREGNEGLFKTAEVLDVCSIGLNQQLYRFFNDKVYSVVPSDDNGPANVQSLKLFDDIPQLCGSLHTVSDKDGNTRLVMGANKRGYDQLDCVDMRFTVTTEQPNECLINIKGKVQIRNWVGTIYNFGALHPEHLALDGFVVYLAGTNYYGISDNFTVSPTGEFEITGVPPGRYIMRVANYKCRFDDSQGEIHNLNNGLEWQKTSSPVLDCAGSLGDTGIPYERILDLTSLPGGDWDMGATSGYGPITIENWDFLNNDMVGIEGYVLDNNADSSTNELRKTSIGMERQQVLFRYNDGLIESPVTVELETDHNGYFWYTYEPVNDPDKYEQFVSTLKVVVADACNPGATIDLDPLTGGIDGYVPDGPLGGPPTIDYEDGWLAIDNATEILATLPSVGVTYPIMYYSSAFMLFNQDLDVSQNNKTIVTGNVKDISGSAVENAVVALERGRAEETSPSGIYSIVAWLPYDSTDSYRYDRLFVTYPPDECGDYPPQEEYLELEIGEYCAEVDFDTSFLVLQDVVFTFSGLIGLRNKYLKSGGLYKTGIVYEDEIGRKSTVMRGPDLYIPFHTEAGVYERPVVSWEIFNRPPEWSDRYRIVLTKDGIYRRFFHWVVEEVKYMVVNGVSDLPTETTYGSGNATHIFFKISQEIDPDEANDPVLFFFRGTNYFAFEPDPGDRIRLILDETGTILPSGIFDMEIVGRWLDAENYYAVVEFTDIGFEVKDNFLVEFYTPNQLEETVYYERGDSYPIVRYGDLKYHGGQTEDQSPTVDSAKGRLVCGDAYWRDRNFTVSTSTSFTYLTENRNFSDAFDSEDQDLGRPNIYDPDFGERYLFNELALSDVYIPTTLINGLPSFRPSEKQVIDRDFGPIRRLIVYGSTLLAICEHKLQPIYIGQGYIMDLEGAQQLGRSSRILNIANQTVHEWGTQNPESVINDGGTVKGFDASKGMVWQYGQNGQVPITQGMVQRWNDIGQTLDNLYFTGPEYNAGDYSWAPATYERKYNTYVLSAQRKGGRDEEFYIVAFFDDQKNGWVNLLNEFYEWYGRVGNWNLQFSGGKMYIADVGPKLSFRGALTDCTIKFVVNTNPTTVKDWFNIELLASDLWTARSIFIPANNLYPEGQLSRLKVARWSRYNGKWCADFMRDINDPAFDNLPFLLRQTTAALRGRPLKGNVMQVTLFLRGNETLDDPYVNSWLKVAEVEWAPAFDTK